VHGRDFEGLCVYACWEWGCLRVLRAWGRLGLIRLPPYGSRHLHDRTLTHPPTVLPASQHCASTRSPKAVGDSLSGWRIVIMSW